MKLVNLRSKIKERRTPLETVAFFDALLIALMFTVLSSAFVGAPGISMELDPINLPSVPNPQNSVFDDNLMVLNVRGKSMLIYDGAIYTLASFAKKMEKEKRHDEILLVKADKNVDAQTILSVCAAAKSAGFKSVQLAAKQEE